MIPIKKIINDYNWNKPRVNLEIMSQVDNYAMCKFYNFAM